MVKKNLKNIYFWLFKKLYDYIKTINIIYMNLDKTHYTYIKNKYFNQNAGFVLSAIFQRLINSDKFNLLKIKFIDNVINFDAVTITYNNNAINIIFFYIYFILPYILNYSDKLDIISNLQIVGNGTFGVTAKYGDYVFKFLLYNSTNINELFYLLIINNKYKGTVPIEINKLYSFIVMSNSIIDNLQGKNAIEYNITKNTFNLNGKSVYIYSNEKMDVPLSLINKAIDKNKKFISADKIEFSSYTDNNVIFVVLEKGEQDLTNFDMKLYNFDEKTISTKFLYNMKNGLHYLHFKLLYIHCDIKNANLIIKKTGDSYVFQLIDFGLIHKIKKTDDIVNHNYGTPMFIVQKDKNTKSILYDWSCILISLLSIIMNRLNKKDYYIYYKDSTGKINFIFSDDKLNFYVSFSHTDIDGSNTFGHICVFLLYYFKYKLNFPDYLSVTFGYLFITLIENNINKKIIKMYIDSLNVIICGVKNSIFCNSVKDLIKKNSIATIIKNLESIFENVTNIQSYITELYKLIEHLHIQQLKHEPKPKPELKPKPEPEPKPEPKPELKQKQEPELKPPPLPQYPKGSIITIPFLSVHYILHVLKSVKTVKLNGKYGDNIGETLKKIFFNKKRKKIKIEYDYFFYDITFSSIIDKIIYFSIINYLYIYTYYTLYNSENKSDLDSLFKMVNINKKNTECYHIFLFNMNKILTCIANGSEIYFILITFNVKSNNPHVSYDIDYSYLYKTYNISNRTFNHDDLYDKKEIINKMIYPFTINTFKHSV